MVVVVVEMGEVGGDAGGEESNDVAVVVVVVVVVVSAGGEFVVEAGGESAGGREERVGRKEDNSARSRCNPCNCFKSCAVISSDSNFDSWSASSASKSGLPVMKGAKGVTGGGLAVWWMTLMGCCKGCARGRSACVANFGNASGA
jgi:hypothetical protein